MGSEVDEATYNEILTVLRKATRGGISDSNRQGVNVAFDFKNGECVLFTFMNEEAADNFLTGINFMIMAIMDEPYQIQGTVRV